jgi:glyoxylase-like metal-dependent hydrolase (beta-lactamase superfamily II)
MAIIADLPGVVVRRISVPPYDNNVYLLTADGGQVLIDAAAEPDAIDALLDEGTGGLDLIVTTHSHSDHIGALAATLARHPAPTAAGRADIPVIERATGVTIDRALDDGDVIGVDGLSLTVIHLLGHTPGSITLALVLPGVPVHLFTGDSIFPGGLGNTDHDPARFDSLYADAVARVFDIYPDDTVVHPGHGHPTTLGAERPALPDWRARGW